MNKTPPDPSVAGGSATTPERGDADRQTRERTEGVPPPADQALEQTGSHPLGATVGAIGGAGAGAVIGIAAGPVGSLAGAVGGAIAGGLLGSGSVGETPVIGPATEADDTGAGSDDKAVQ